MSAVNVPETHIPARFLQIAEDHVEELDKMVTDGEDFFFVRQPVGNSVLFSLAHCNTTTKSCSGESAMWPKSDMIWTWNFGITMSRHVESCISCMPHLQNGTFVERTVCVGDSRDGRVLQKLTARCVDGLLQRQTTDWVTGKILKRTTWMTVQFWRRFC